MGINGIGGYPQPYTSMLSNGPTAVQQTRQPDPNEEARNAEETRRQQAQTQPAGGNTTPTRGQLLNITA